MPLSIVFFCSIYSFVRKIFCIPVRHLDFGGDHLLPGYLVDDQLLPGYLVGDHILSSYLVCDHLAPGYRVGDNLQYLLATLLAIIN